MTGTRQNKDNENSRNEPLSLVATDVTLPQNSSSTASIRDALQRKSSIDEPTTSDELLKSFLIIARESRPPAALKDSDLVHTQHISDTKKVELGVKRSSHTIEIVACKDQACDIVFSPDFPNDLNLNQLPGNANGCYVLTPNKKMYYANKQRKLLTPITISLQVFDSLCQSIKIKIPENDQGNDYICLAENISTEHLQIITDTTKHIHNMAFYKQNPIGTAAVQIEADNSIEALNSVIYQILGPYHFPPSKVVRNAEHQYIGVISKLLPGFKPNRDKPLLLQDLEISSLKNMIKLRDDHDIKALDQTYGVLAKLIPLMNREVSVASSIFSGLWQFGAQNFNYYLGDPYCAVHVKPQFEDFLKENKHSVTFGKLHNLRQLLINRKSNIEKTKESYVATLHQHESELVLLNTAIEQLNQILLDEIALFMKHLDRISRQLQDEWVDLEDESANPNSKYANIQIEEGLSTKLTVSLTDILHYRNNCGLAIGLTSGYFGMDPDRHNKNLASDGKNVDGDLAVHPLTYRFKNPVRKPGATDYILDKNDFLEFPKLSIAYFRYWPTVVTLADTSVDTALSSVCDVTKNYFNVQDSHNFQSLENSPVFNFQKYIQLIIFALTDKIMYSSCAKLHMNDQLHMLNDEGDINAPLPLYNKLGQSQDVMTKWVECLSDRAQEARHLAQQLEPVKNMLWRHNDLVLKMVQDHFNDFLRFQKMELNNDNAFHTIEETMSHAIIEKAFNQLRREVVPWPLTNESIAFTGGATMGALSDGESSKNITAKLSKHIGKFLDGWDGAMLARTNNKAWETARKEERSERMRNCGK